MTSLCSAAGTPVGVLRLGRLVDLVVERSVINPYLRQRVNAERQSVYAA